MNETPSKTDSTTNDSRNETMAALFADLILRQTNLALMFLGQVPPPGAKEATVDLETAQSFIDQLEMIEVKTRGNLSKPEEQFLKHNLTQLRMLYVHVSEQPPQPAATAPPQPEAPSTPPPPPVASDNKTDTPPAEAPGEESKPRFSKKY
jgi:hypothetical protein